MRASLSVLVSLGATLVACAPLPVQPVAESLDPSTGTTVVVMTQPVELLTETNRGPARDPFAFAAPFAIDRMGDRALFLWVSTPQDNGATQQLHVFCNGEPLALSAMRLDLKQVGLSHPPYPTVAPWSGEWYFPLPETALQCLAGAQHMSAVTRLADGAEEHFSADAGSLRTIAAFAAHYGSPLSAR